MSRQATEVWLAELQRSFGSVLRTPLDAESGSLRAQPERYDSPLVAAVSGRARERLAVYNRQYWFRLFTVMQTSWPLTARLLGLFHFNLYAQRFLLQTPPAHYDLRMLTCGFEAHLADSIQDEAIDLGPRYAPLPKRALLEAARIDAAFASVFHAPAQPDFDPSQCAAAELVERKLVSSAAHARVQEHWPLLQLRLTLRDDRSEHAVALPPALAAAQTWSIYRTPRGVAQLQLAPLQARLLTLLESLALGQALAQLEAEAEPSARAALPEQTRAWIAQGVANGSWIGLIV